MKNPNFWKYLCLPLVSTSEGLTLPTLYWQTKIFLLFQVLKNCRLIFDGIWQRNFKFQKLIVASSWLDILQIQVAVRLIFGGIWQGNFKLQKVIVVPSDFVLIRMSKENIFDIFHSFVEFYSFSSSRFIFSTFQTEVSVLLSSFELIYWSLDVFTSENSRNNETGTGNSCLLKSKINKAGTPVQGSPGLQLNFRFEKKLWVFLIHY